jgi:hypothetical protein
VSKVGEDGSGSARAVSSTSPSPSPNPNPPISYSPSIKAGGSGLNAAVTTKTVAFLRSVLETLVRYLDGLLGKSEAHPELLGYPMDESSSGRGNPSGSALSALPTLWKKRLLINRIGLDKTINCAGLLPLLIYYA